MFNATILWHMHQPYYVNPLTKTAMMPWVRLHGVKGYLDMIDVAMRYPELRVNFNFTPVLVLQLLELAERRVTDLWESWSRKDPSELTPDEKVRILSNFFMIHWDNLIFPYPRFKQLLETRGRNYDANTIKESIGHFSDQDFRDLQTWYNLSWCGFSAEKRFPELAELKRKGSRFTEHEKHRVLDIHHEILLLILNLYREAVAQGRIEITTTPFFHPIMPLVYDTDIAQRCMPGRQLPPRFSAPEDVRAHLMLAQKQHETVFGTKARGLWPSEGSVCPEIIPIIKEAGIEYLCTDEGVLFNSLHLDPAWQGRHIDHLELFQPWCIEHDGARIQALFRERPLSDFIGFNASRNSAEGASHHLLHHMEHIANVAGKPHGCLTLALDGENAWETFNDGGESFLCQFYEKCMASQKFKLRRLGDYLDECRDSPTVSRLHSGSWINSDFDIWIGDSEENKAWEWIGNTRAFLAQQAASGNVPQEKLDLAWMEIYAAEGSDWFWWYGPDFQTDSDFLFDELFRTHLQNVYRILDREPPKYLDIPICLSPTAANISIRPSDFISPSLRDSGKTYYDWLGAGSYDILRQQSAMFQSDRMARNILYGFDDTRFYLRLDVAERLPHHLIIYFHRPTVARITIPTSNGQPMLETSPDGVEYQPAQATIECRAGKRLECAINHSALGWKNEGETVAFLIQLFDNGLERERYPERGMIEFQAPSHQFRLKHWFV